MITATSEAAAGRFDMHQNRLRALTHFSAESTPCSSKQVCAIWKTVGTNKVARGLDEPELLRYRSNLLGSDLRITNFGGGNTSSKIHAS